MAFSLHSLLGRVTSLFGSGTSTPTSVVGIDIGSAFLKVVQLKQEKTRIVLETYGEVALGPYDNRVAGELTSLPPEKIAEALQNILREANATASHRLLALESSASLAFILHLPKISERDLNTTIPNEARKYIPVPLSEVSLDWWVLPDNLATSSSEEEHQNTQTTGTMDVFVAALRTEALLRYRTIASSAGFSSGVSYEMEIFSAVRSSLKHDLTPILIIDCGASGTRAAVVEYGVVKKFHAINRGSYHMSQAIAQSLGIPFDQAETLKKSAGLSGPTESEHEKNAQESISTAAAYLISEIENVLGSYEREYHKAVEKIYLVGGGALLVGFREALEQKFSLPAVVSDPFEKAQSPAFLVPVLKNAGPSFAVAFGCALKQLQ